MHPVLQIEPAAAAAATAARIVCYRELLQLM